MIQQSGKCNLRRPPDEHGPIDMRTRKKFVLFAIAPLILPFLGGCGDSHPISPVSGGNAAVPDVQPTQGRFAAIGPNVLARSAEPVANCNLDAIDGVPPGSKPLQRNENALFAGWAANQEGAAVPGVVEIVLHGARDFAVLSATGMPRPDVATANHQPGLANAGYALEADLSAVVPGKYQIVLLYQAGSQSLRCNLAATLVVR
ncbi:MAG TPA: hypothetical protein VHA71_05130 [Rhodanobacteraceae bacterium]|nr:hypothetical protein [Rhodanobacteraceae bacterium]